MSLLQPFVLHFEVFFFKKEQEEKEEEEGSRQLEFEIPSPRELCGSNCKIIFIFLFYEVGEIN
jgi:hypothetical protein